VAIQVLHHALNVGVVDRNKIHRIDLQRMRLAAEDQTNLLCEATGRMFLRPGFEYLDASHNNTETRLITFEAGATASYILEMSADVMRVRDGTTDELITRPAVTATIPNGDFSSGTGWTLSTELDLDSVDINTGVAGTLRLRTYSLGQRAFAKRSVTCNEPGTEHGLRIVVTRGQVTFRCGSTEGGDEYISETVLRTGDHSLAFVPTGDFWVQFSNTEKQWAYVDSIEVEAAGPIVLPTIWDEDHIWKMEFSQSLDVMFVAAHHSKQQRIERRGNGASAGRSWSVCDYDSVDGPFGSGRTADVTLAPSVTDLTGTLTASEPFFNDSHIGTLFKIYHDGQKVVAYLGAAGEFTPTIMVTGVNETDYNERDWTLQMEGTWTGTLRVQRSFDGEDIEFHDFRRAQTVSTVDITANATFTNDDNEDNAITWYRVKCVAYTSGEAKVTLTYDGGGGYGIARVTSIDSATVAQMDVLVPFKGTEATKFWQQSEWGGEKGDHEVTASPNGVDFHEGRLFFVGNDRIWGSVSDAYESFDEDFVGDAGPLIRAIAVGGRNVAQFVKSISNLMVGCDTRVVEARSSSLDEIMTPENFGLHLISQVGTSPVTPVAISDDRIIYVADDGKSLFEANYSGEKARFIASEFSKLTTDIFVPGVKQLVLQNRPDQRIWAVTEDDAPVCIVYEPLQEMVAFVPISTSAATDVIESMCVLRGIGQDRVYAAIKRVVDGNTVRYIEKMARDVDAVPGDICKCVDSFVEFGAGVTQVDCSHLIGRTVVGWMDGDAINDAGTTTTTEFVVPAGGMVTLPSESATGGVLGLKYRGRFKSARLAYGSENTTVMLKNKSLTAVGLLLADYCRSGVKYGTEFDNSNHPLRSMGKLNAKGAVADEVISGPDDDEELKELGDEVGFDSRLCLEFNSPKPASVLSLIMSVENYG
jgi:hypothetical protein